MSSISITPSLWTIDRTAQRLICPEDHPVFFSDIVLEPILEERPGGVMRPTGTYTWRALVNTGEPNGNPEVEYRTGTAAMILERAASGSLAAPGSLAPPGRIKLVHYVGVSTEAMTVLDSEMYSPLDEAEVPVWTLTPFQLGSDPVLYTSK